MLLKRRPAYAIMEEPEPYKRGGIHRAPSCRNAHRAAFSAAMPRAGGGKLRAAHGRLGSAGRCGRPSARGRGRVFRHDPFKRRRSLRRQGGGQRAIRPDQRRRPGAHRIRLRQIELRRRDGHLRAKRDVRRDGHAGNRQNRAALHPSDPHGRGNVPGAQERSAGRLARRAVYRRRGRRRTQRRYTALRRAVSCRTGAERRRGAERAVRLSGRRTGSGSSSRSSSGRIPCIWDARGSAPKPAWG